MPNSSRKTIFTTISIDKETAALVEKICKRYSLKKSEVVKLAFGYIDKAHINPSEAPESVKSELAKINKRQDDIIRFIRHYEEEQLNPMIRATNSIALRFDAIGKTLETLILSQLEVSQERQTAVLKKLSEQFCNHADVINNQSKQINALYQIHQRDYKKLLHPKADATWALEPGGSLKLLALLFVISLMASFIPYVVEQITLRRTTSGAFSVMQSINPAMAVAVGLAFGEIPSVGEIVGVALVICAVIVTFSGDAAPADVQ